VILDPADNPPRGVILRSANMVLHPVNAADGPNYVKHYGSEAALAFLDSPWDAGQMAADAKANHERWARQGFASWMVDIVEPSGSVSENVAMLGFHDVNAPEGEVEFGWIIAPAHQGRRISTEASRMALEWLFSQFPDLTVVTKTKPTNVKSIRTSERLGFRLRENTGGRYICELNQQDWGDRRDPPSPASGATGRPPRASS
jgi:RimJ/RimL family protein N-acetyltransferase